MILEVRAVPPFFKNGYVVGCEETRDAVVIDPANSVSPTNSAVSIEPSRATARQTPPGQCPGVWRT